MKTNNDKDFPQVEANIQSLPNIRPLAKSRKPKTYIAIGVIGIAISTISIAAYQLKDKNNKTSNINKHQETPKIENISPKNFDKLPENAPINTIAVPDNASSLETAPQSIADGQINNITNDLYNSALCSSCSNEAQKEQTSFKVNAIQENQDKKDNFTELEPAKLQASKASYIKNQEFIIAKGAFLDAILETKIDSTLKGMVSAVLAQDIYSMNGAVLLLEKGSKITGQYTSEIKEGAERLMVIWDRLRTPNGIIIDLNSFGTDSLGGSGFNGHVNHQYAKRFGSAILLSIIDDSLAIAANKSDITNSIQNTQQQGRSIAEQALNNNINIAPILYKNQGEHINIFIARDLDFSNIYKLRIKG